MKIISLLFSFYLNIHIIYGQCVTFCDLQQNDSIYFLDNIPYTGNVISTYKNGKLEIKGCLTEGKPDSLWFEYKRNGKLSMLYFFNKGEEIYRHYYSYRISGTFFYNKANCPYYEFDRKGNIKKQGHYLEGKRNGLWKKYYKNGKLKMEIKYNKGKKVYPYFKWNKKNQKYKFDFCEKEHKMGDLKLEVGKVCKTKTD